MRTNKDNVIDKFKQVHGEKYDYSLVEYVKADNKVKIICPKHGMFLQTCSHHLNGVGCKTCAARKNLDTQSFVNEATLIHGQDYDYSETIYINYFSKVKIKCNRCHEFFYQTPKNHIYAKHGCKNCNLSLSSYKKEEWIKKAKGRKGIFYIIKCYNDIEMFYKAGITFRTVNKRYNGIIPYTYEVLREISSENLEYIWDLEKRFIKSKKNNLYSPLLKFGGSKKECFTLL